METPKDGSINSRGVWQPDPTEKDLAAMPDSSHLPTTYRGAMQSWLRLRKERQEADNALAKPTRY
jgi:hypothetical protein